MTNMEIVMANLINSVNQSELELNLYSNMLLTNIVSVELVYRA